MEHHLETLDQVYRVIGMRENVMRARIEKNYLVGRLNVSETLKFHSLLYIFKCIKYEVNNNIIMFFYFKRPLANETFY